MQIGLDLGKSWKVERTVEWRVVSLPFEVSPVVLFKVGLEGHLSFNTFSPHVCWPHITPHIV